MRDWRRYALDLEAMLASECDLIYEDVDRAVWIEVGARCWLNSDRTRELAQVVAQRVAHDRWSGFHSTNPEGDKP